MPVKNKYQSIIVVHHYHQNELKKSRVANYSGYVAGRSNLPFSIYPLSRFILTQLTTPFTPFPVSPKGERPRPLPAIAGLGRGLLVTRKVGKVVAVRKEVR
jgi:hypothetical protein